VKKFYPADFSDQEKAQVKSQLPHYQIDIRTHSDLQNSSSLADLTTGLVKVGKASIYSMVDRLLRLVITLPISTATTERVFSAMKLIKMRLRNWMGDGFLRDYMVVYTEKEIADKFISDEIIDTFDLLGSRRSKLRSVEI
jgi:hAT family C-terminal dimerisation region